MTATPNGNTLFYGDNLAVLRAARAMILRYQMLRRPP